MNNEQRIKYISEKLHETLQPTYISIQDDSSKHIGHEGAKTGAGHFSIEIASSMFEDKSLLECHRLIYQALDGAIPTEIHALKIKIKRSS